MTLEKLKNSQDYLDLINSFIKIKKQPTLGEIIEFCHLVSPELKTFCNQNKNNFANLNPKDKGLFGKIVEFYLFGNLPNPSSKPDTKNGEIKTTNLKKLKDGSYNAKERLTLTNFGNPYKKEVLDEILTKESIQNTKYFKKLSKGILFVSIYENFEIKKLSEILNKKIVCIVPYDLNKLNNDDLSQIEKDFNVIKNCLLDGNPTQAGQKYLHIPRHSSGGKNMSRAFAFTNKFLTKLIINHMEFEILEKNNSYSFNIE